MTEEQLQKLLDKQAKAIADQLDKRLDERLKTQEERLTEHFDKRLDTQLASLFGQVTKHFDARFDELRNDLTSRIDQVQTTVDGIAQHLDTFEQEQTIINHQVDGKLDQLAEATGIKWVTE
jgi:DNA anti-recombination protein RmuC